MGGGFWLTLGMSVRKSMNQRNLLAHVEGHIIKESGGHDVKDVVDEERDV